MTFWEMVVAVALGNLLWDWFDPAPSYCNKFGWKLLALPVVLVRRWIKRGDPPATAA